METVTIDVINTKAFGILKELERLELIRLHNKNDSSKIDWSAKYKGSVTKQSVTDIDKQLNELRNGWE